MSADVLGEFTKQEIIQWVRDKGLFLRINRRDLLFIRWQMQSRKLQSDYQTELDRWDAEKPDFKSAMSWLPDSIAPVTPRSGCAFWVKWNHSTPHFETT